MKIYISHATEDREAAERLARELGEAGHEAGLPESDVLPGDNWAEAVGRALADSEAMVVLLTPEALRSRWVRSEITYALGNERFEGRLFPVAISSAERLPEEEVPWILRSFRWLSIDPGHEGETARQISHALSPAFA
jgi:hypothetical protein